MSRTAPRCALLAITFITGCGGPQGMAPGDGTVYDLCAAVRLEAPSGASSEQRASITRAAALWAAVNGPTLMADGSADSDLPRLPIRFEKAAPLFFGLYRPDHGDILVNSRLESPDARAITIAHELGHAFGLAHVTDRPSVMNPGNLNLPPTGADVARMRELRGVCASGVEAP